MQPDLEQLKEFNECELCHQVLCRPVFLPKCGHSPWCQQCVAMAKPKPKTCSVCGENVSGAPGKWPLNKALGSVLRYLYADEYAKRPSDDQLKYELDRQNAVNRLQAALDANEAKGEACRSVLPPNYKEKALEIVKLAYPSNGLTPKTEVLQWCQCDLIRLPRFSSKRNTWFFGCPGWSFQSKKRKRGEEAPTDAPSYCDSFKWLSSAMREILEEGSDLLGPKEKPAMSLYAVPNTTT